MESTTTTEWREEDLTPYTTERSTFDSVISTDINHNSSLFYCASKRLLDVVLATFGIIVLIPVFVVITVAIKLEDGGKIFYFR